VAGLFPMLAEDELAELAEDIKTRGLLHPIVLDVEGRVLDGRNRLAACELAGVEPIFTTYHGDDPDGYALAVNIARRHMTSSQRAITVARAVRIIGLTLRDGSERFNLNHARIGQANTILDYAPDLSDAVASGATALDEAYRIARERKTAADSVENQLARLRAEDPELASKVVEDELTLAGAQAELRARQAQRDSERRAAIANLRSVLTYLVSASISPAELAGRDYAAALDEFKQEDLDYAAATMAAIAALKEN